MTRFLWSRTETQPMNASESGLRTALVYFFVLTTCGLAIWLTLSLGSGLRTDAGRGSVVSPAAVRLDYQGGIQTIARMLTANLRQPLGVLLLQLILIIVAARLLGSLSLKIGQPRVIGEMVAGILLGPSFLGYFSPAALDFLFPPSSIEHLRLFSQVGIILYMFLVGIELDLQSIRKMAHTAVWVSHASIVVPFLLGTVLSFFIYRSTAPVGVPFSVFALFIGVSMSITAFPVLARIIEERGLSRSPLGIMAIACAAVDDVTAWCILAFVLAIATSGDLGGFGHGSHWSSRIIRRFPCRDCHAAGKVAGILQGPPGNNRRRSAATTFLRVYGFAYANYSAWKLVTMADLCLRHWNCDRGEAWREHARCPIESIRMARGVCAWRIDEHARPDGTRRSEYWS